MCVCVCCARVCVRVLCAWMNRALSIWTKKEEWITTTTVADREGTRSSGSIDSFALFGQMRGTGGAKREGGGLKSS